MTSKTFHVQLTSFSGMVSSARHAYVSIREFLPDGSVSIHEMFRKITADEAVELNRLDSRDGWKEGMEVSRFDTEKDAEDAAKEWLKANATTQDEVFWGLDFYTRK